MIALCRSCRAKSFRERSSPPSRRCARCGSAALIVFSPRGLFGRVVPATGVSRQQRRAGALGTHVERLAQQRFSVTG